MTQVLIDTIIVCSITGITIVMADMYSNSTLNGGDLTAASFAFFLGDTGSYIVTVGIVLFAFSTLVGWSYYGEKCFGYLFKEKAIPAYRVLFVLVVFYGAIEKLGVVWGIADIMNALMAIPNLIGLLGLSGVVVYETKKFLKVAKEEEKERKRSKAA